MRRSAEPCLWQQRQYIQMDNRNFVMRRILSKEESIELIRFIPEISSEWITDDIFRKAKFNKIIQSGDQRKTIQLINPIRSFFSSWSKFLSEKTEMTAKM